MEPISALCCSLSFFRQMPELIERGHLYIAQPPLYKVSRGKSSQYIKNEAAFEEFLIDTGLEETTLELSTEKFVQELIYINSLKMLVYSVNF